MTALSYICLGCKRREEAPFEMFACRRCGRISCSACYPQHEPACIEAHLGNPEVAARANEIRSKYLEETHRAAASIFDELEISLWARESSVALETIFRGIQDAVDYAQTHKQLVPAFFTCSRFIRNIWAQTAAQDGGGG